MLLVMIVEMMAMFMISMMMTKKSHLRNIEKRGIVDSPITSPLRMIAVQIDSITLLDWMVFSEELASYFFSALSLPGAAGVECSIAREMGNTVILSISPDLMRISVSP